MGLLPKNSFSMSLADFSPQVVDHEKGRKLRRSKKYLSPHLVGSEKAKKLTPLKNSFVLAPNWSHFHVQDCSWLRIGAIFRLWQQN